MKMESPQMGSVGFEKFTATSTAKGGCLKQRTGHVPAISGCPSSRSVETMTDLQSYGLMEERYGIQEEGIF
jgi:hypothetical protein